MDTSQIDQLSHILQGLISTGLGMRVVYLLIKLMHEDEEAARYRKRLKNTVVFAIIAQVPFVVKDIIISYLS